MNLLNIILNEKAIGGLDIADDGFRFSRLTKDKSGLKVDLLFEDLITEKEALAGKATLTNKLQKFIKQHNLEYVVVTISANHVYVKTYDFNNNMEDNKIEEAMALNIELQLPKKMEEIYCDWMKIDSTDNKKILLAYASRNYVRSLIEIIKNTSLRIVAIESHQLSLARTLKQTKDEVTLVIERGGIYISFYLIKNNNLIFSQSLPDELVGKNINNEVNNIINYQDYQGVTINKIILIGTFTDIEIKKLPIEVTNLELIDELKQVQNSKWAIVLGAALRGLIPRKDDKIISLMQINTTKAYRQEKANGSVGFLVSISIALCIFFVSVFVANWYFISVTESNYNQQISSLNNLAASDNSVSLRDKASSFNDLINQASSLAKKETAWSKIISEIKDKTTGDIIINNVTLPSVNGVLSITGVAASREAINTLLMSFESSSLFQEVNIPLNNLGKKTDIPFSMTFKIKV